MILSASIELTDVRLCSNFICVSCKQRIFHSDEIHVTFYPNVRVKATGKYGKYHRIMSLEYIDQVWRWVDKKKLPLSSPAPPRTLTPDYVMLLRRHQTNNAIFSAWFRPFLCFRNTFISWVTTWSSNWGAYLTRDWKGTRESHMDVPSSAYTRIEKVRFVTLTW